MTAVSMDWRTRVRALLSADWRARVGALLPALVVIASGVIAVSAMVAIGAHNKLPDRQAAIFPIGSLPRRPVLQIELARSPSDVKAILEWGEPTHAENVEHVREGIQLDSWRLVPAYTVLFIALTLLIVRRSGQARMLLLAGAVLAVAVAVADWSENRGVSRALDLIPTGGLTEAHTAGIAARALWKWLLLGVLTAFLGIVAWLQDGWRRALSPMLLALSASIVIPVGRHLADRLTPGDLSALATAAVQGSLLALDDELARHGQEVDFRFDTSPNIAIRLRAGEVPDVLIAQSATVEQAIADGTAIAETRATVGRIAVGVAVRRGGRSLDLSSVDALKASLLDADGVVITQGASGLYVDALLRDMGIAEAMTAKVERVAVTEDVIARVASSRANKIGFLMVSEIKRGERRGVSLVGLVPAAVQRHTAYDAIVMSRSRAPEAARAFVRALTAPGGRRALAAYGWEF